ncbi:hypothetical protein WJX77_002127 [Trebouxia sp. C0004]
MQTKLFSSSQHQRHTTGLHRALTAVYTLKSRTSRTFLLCSVNMELSSRGACACSVQQATQLSPDVSRLRPELRQEWHFHKNTHFGTAQVNPFSFEKAVWRCPRCHHEWEERIIDRACTEAYTLKCCQSAAVTGCFGYAGNALRSGRMSSRLLHWNAQRDRTHAARSVRARKPAYAMKPHEPKDALTQPADLSETDNRTLNGSKAATIY